MAAKDITAEFVQLFDLYHPVHNPTGDRAGMATNKKQVATVAVAAEEEVPTVVAEATEAVIEEIPPATETEPIAVVRKFDPMSKLVKVKGNQLYLQVRDRLIWLREEHPEARISTYLQEYYPENGMWVVKAEVEIWVEANGSYQQATGSGMGQETERDFPAGALEKAETKAIGRALATLGYGTQFALEMDEGSLADAPATTTPPQLTVLRQEGRQYINPGSNGKLTAAGVEALREDVIELLNVDTDAAQKLPKGAGQMTEDELSRTIVWLRARADRG